MPQSISEAIGEDHKYLDHCYDEIKSAPDAQKKTEWRNELVWNLARHAISEELTMYPAMEKHMGTEGKELTDVDREQHQAVKEDLAKLQDMNVTDPKFDPLLETLMKDLHHHIEHESEEDMPRLEKLLSRAESEQLAASFQRTKMITPTRSHPSAPNKPYFENLVGLMVAPIDKIQDLMKSFPAEGRSMM